MFDFNSIPFQNLLVVLYFRMTTKERERDNVIFKIFFNLFFLQLNSLI